MTHPLDQTIAYVTEWNETANYFGELPPDRSDMQRLVRIGDGVTGMTYEHLGKTPHLETVLVARDWLEDLGVSDPWAAMREEYDRAKAKHGDMTLDSDKPTNEQRFYALMEEVGEVARALTYDKDHAGELTEELTQLGALALAWLARELDKEQQ